MLWIVAKKITGHVDQENEGVEEVEGGGKNGVPEAL